MVSLLLLVILISVCWPTTADKQLCRTILFGNINEHETPWIQVVGVYERFSTNDGFPVYLNSATSLFFYYSNDATRGIKALSFGDKIGDVFGVVGVLPSSFNPETWLRSGNVNKNDVFGDLATTWKYYSPLEKTFHDISQKLKAVCVDDDLIQCDSERVYLNDIITGTGSRVLNDPKTDYFSKLHGVYSEIRPVFKHNKQNWYLYYNSAYWRIGTSYISKYNDIFRNNDGALRPEFVTGKWEKWSGTSWVDTGSDLRVLCRGVSSGENMCKKGPVCSRGTCVFTKGNETVCKCPDRYYGPRCEKTQTCSAPGIPSSGVDVVWRGTRPGDIATLFCKTGYISVPMEYYICEGTAGWLRESKASCQNQVSTTSATPTIATNTKKTTFPVDPKSQTTKKPWNKSLDFLIFFGPCLAFQLIIPCFIWLGVIITDMVHQCNKTPPRTIERTEAIGNIQKGKYTKLFRIYSAFFNLVFWLWLGFLCACAVSSDLQQTHENLYYCTMGMCFFCIVFVAVEGFFSNERLALRNIVTREYLQHLQRVPPLIEMEVERFDWKEVQSGGLHTSPTTGYLEYRNSIHRKVGKTFVREPFVFDSWTDNSSSENSFNGKLTFIRLNTKISLEGDRTTVSFEQQKEALIHKTDHLSRSYNFSRKDSVPGLHRFIILCPNARHVPFWMKEEYFWYATFLQLSWPYRLFLTSSTGYSEYTIQKSVFSNQENSNSEIDDTTETSNQATSKPAVLYQFPDEVNPNTSLINGQQHKNYMTV